MFNNNKIRSFLIAECICRAAAIASLARTTDFVANVRPMDSLITHPNEVKFTPDTMNVSIVLKRNYFSITTEKEKIKSSVLGVSRRSSAYSGLSPVG